MKIPKRITVLGDVITVHQVDDKTIKKVAGEHDILGLAMLLEGKILLLKTLSNKEKHRVLIHEICHFVMYKTAANIGISGELEEVVCQSFSTAFAQLGLNFK